MKNQGYATVTISMILLFMMLMMGIMTANTAFMEQKVVNNEFRATQAFTAAEAGLSFGTSYLEANKVAILNDNDNDGSIDPYSHASITNVTLADGTQYNITYQNVLPNNFGLINITSAGTSADGVVTRQVQEIYAVNAYLANAPKAPLVSKDGINLSGNVTISNNQLPTTIWTGGLVNLAGAASTNTGSGGSSSGNIGSDVVQNDILLGNMSNPQFFENFLGVDYAEAKATADTVITNNVTTNYSGTLDGVLGQSIWIDQTAGTAEFSGNAVIGSPDHPVILVVDGDFQANGNTTVYGFVYVKDNWDNTGGGTLDVFGSVVVEGEITGNGTPTVTYQQAILDKLQETIGNYSKLAGSWHDF